MQIALFLSVQALEENLVWLFSKYVIKKQMNGTLNGGSIIAEDRAVVKT